MSELADELNMTPMGAVYYLASEAMKEAPTSLRTHRMMPADGDNILQNSTMTLSGNPNKDLSAAGMSSEQVVAVQNNIDTCVQSGNCTPQQIHNFSEALPEPYKTAARHIENKWSGAAKLGRFLGGGADAAYFYESVQYMNPDNLTLATLKQMLGKSVTEKDKNSLQLKNTQSFYTIKDGRVYVDFTQQGLIKTGTEELQKRATYVRHQLEKAGLTTEEQVDFYDRFYPNMTSIDPRAGDKLPIWMQDAFSIMQDYTIGRGAAIDTQFAAWLDNRNKEWLEPEKRTTMTADEAFEALNKNTTGSSSGERNVGGLLNRFEGSVSIQSNRKQTWVNTATGEVEEIIPASGWIQDEYDGKPYSYIWDGDYLEIQTGDDLLIIKTSATPEQVIADYVNDPDTLHDYEYVKHLKRTE